MNLKVCVPAGLLLVTVLFSCQQQAPKQEEHSSASTAALQAPYSQVYYDSLQSAMSAYHQLTAAFVKSDSGAASLAAAVLRQHIDSLPVQLLQMDSARLSNITGIKGSISAELTGLCGEPSLDGKRASYQMVSDMLYDLVKNTGLKGHTLYHQYCPMAFDDKGAYWLSDKAGIENPYFGSKMLHCGETSDSLIYK
ncbi:DUF3347 domain-containing protein [Chitinophaga vietnamensis]|uniref:DUF3347 domain-containing protein n=1 Tax=Chitinophaga vietnamensis TaxID=2593957 RepID=UPI00117856B5|nr:DUF3347 domain-containing protein [Chitinophaga vietnamensis]